MSFIQAIVYYKEDIIKLQRFNQQISRQTFDATLTVKEQKVAKKWVRSTNNNITQKNQKKVCL